MERNSGFSSMMTSSGGASAQCEKKKMRTRERERERERTKYLEGGSSGWKRAIGDGEEKQVRTTMIWEHGKRGRRAWVRKKRL
jgi:hypothetical protein